MARKDPGKEFERAVNGMFKDLKSKHPIRWDRVLDSHDAGNLVGATDCDFKLSIRSDSKGRPWVFYIECKHSDNYNSLSDGGARRKLISAHQIARMRLADRAGILGLFFFHSKNSKTMEVWPAPEVCKWWALKRTKWDGSPIVELSMIEDAAEQFILSFLDQGTPRGPYEELLWS